MKVRYPQPCPHLWGAPSLGTKVRNYPVSLTITTLPSVGGCPPPRSPKAHVAEARPCLSGEAPSVRPRLYSPRYRRVLKHPKPTILRAHLRSYKERSRHLCKVMGAFIPRAQRRSRYERKRPLGRSVTECVRRGAERGGFPLRKDRCTYLSISVEALSSSSEGERAPKER